MRLSEIEKLAPVVIKTIVIPAEQAGRLKRRVTAVSFAERFATEFFQRVMDDAQIAQSEAWDECARLAEFESLADCHLKGFQMTLSENILTVRETAKDPEYKEPSQ